MKPLLVLLAAFAFILAATWLGQGHPGWALAGNGALAVMLVFTGAAHFPYVNGMIHMLPEWLPGRRAWVLGTGVLEVVLGLALLGPASRVPAAWAIIVFLLLVFPANILAAVKNLDYQTGSFNGPGLLYLLFRGPLQTFFIAWAWFFGVYLAG